jgi:hypothetical protein
MARLLMVLNELLFVVRSVAKQLEHQCQACRYVFVVIYHRFVAVENLPVWLKLVVIVIERLKM